MASTLRSVRSPTGVVHVDRGYVYSSTGDSFSGGFSGGPLAGTLNVAIIDNWTKDGIPGAFVAVGDPATTAYKGLTNALGQITFSGPDLVGPVVVTAYAADHEVATFHCVAAENLSIWLRAPIPPPQGGPPGVGTNGGIDPVRGMAWPRGRMIGQSPDQSTGNRYVSRPML